MELLQPLQQHRLGYLNNRPCEGVKRSLDHYSLTELQTLARGLGLKAGGLKDDLCKRLRAHYTHVEKLEPAAAVMPLVQQPVKKTKPVLKEKVKPVLKKAAPAIAVAAPAGADMPAAAVADEGIGPFVLSASDKGYYLAGPTYEIKEELKEKAKARWFKEQSVWWFPAEHVEKVRAILQRAARDAPPINEDTSGKYATLAGIMESLSVTDVRELVRLKEGHLQTLVDILDATDHPITFKERVAGMSESETVRVLLELLGGKLCRCIKSIRAKQKDATEATSVAICISSIFQRRGLRIHGFRCDKDGLLLPSAGGLVLESII